MRARAWLGLLASGVLILMAGFLVNRPDRSRRVEDPRRALADVATFVGSETCAPCHDAETALWRGSHHDLAMQPATDATVLGDFDDATFRYNGVTSTFFRRDGGFMVNTDGPDGELRDYTIAYAFGVDPLQQYLIPVENGRLQALSIAWDSRPADEGGQRWFHLYPDDRVDHRDVLHWTGQGQTWNFMCAECHSTNVRKGYAAETASYDTTWSEIDVACEACHGPGSEHLVWADAAARGQRTDDRIRGLVVDLSDRDDAVWTVDIASGLATRSVPRTSNTTVEACARCHSRRSVIADRYDYGRPLLDSHRPALLTEGLYFSDGQIHDEVYVYGSFLQSKMYAAGVTCRDCHDSHALTVRGEGNARCAGCHLPAKFDTPEHHHHDAGTPGAACVECHMPATTYMGVDPRRDHSFRLPRPDLTTALGTPNACTGCHTDRAPAWAADAVARWFGPDRPDHYGEVLAAGRRRLPGAAEALASLAVDRTRPAIVRATAVSALLENPGRNTAEAVRTALADPDPLVRLAGATAAESLPTETRLAAIGAALTDAVRGVRAEAARVLADVPDRLLDEPTRASLARAVDEYRASQLANADRAESHVNLGVLHVRRGEFDEAERAYARALAINPSFVPAYANLADLLRSQARDADVEPILARGLAQVPDAADLHHALGLLRVRQGRRQEALASLGRAAALLPQQPRYAFVFGVALNSAGQADRALEVLDGAHRDHPGDTDLLLALTTISRDQGDIEAAVGYARQLRDLDPANPQISQLLAQLEAARP